MGDQDKVGVAPATFTDPLHATSIVSGWGWGVFVFGFWFWFCFFTKISTFQVNYGHGSMSVCASPPKLKGLLPCSYEDLF